MSLTMRLLFVTLNLKLWRSDIGAHIMVSVYILKMGTTFSMTALD